MDGGMWPFHAMGVRLSRKLGFRKAPRDGWACVKLVLSRRETPGEPAWPDPHDRRRSAPKRVPFPRKADPVRLGGRSPRGPEPGPGVPHLAAPRRLPRLGRVRFAAAPDPRPLPRNRPHARPPRLRDPPMPPERPERPGRPAQGSPPGNHALAPLPMGSSGSRRSWPMPGWPAVAPARR